jgi:hypothetical protein
MRRASACWGRQQRRSLGHHPLWAALAFIIRPVLVGLCLIPARLENNGRNFVLFDGLKGAVPILLGGVSGHGVCT